MARIDELKTELALVRSERLKAIKAVSMSTGSRSITFQRLEELNKQESLLTWQIDEINRGGPFKMAEIENEYL